MQIIASNYCTIGYLIVLQLLLNWLSGQHIVLDLWCSFVSVSIQASVFMNCMKSVNWLEPTNQEQSKCDYLGLQLSR